MTKKELYEELRDFYCEVETQQEADHLFFLCRHLCPELCSNSEDMRVDNKYYYFMMPYENIPFVAETDRVYGLTRLSYDDMTNKLQNLYKKGGNNTIELTDQETFFLSALLGGINNTESARIVSFFNRTTCELERHIKSNPFNITSDIYEKIFKIVEKKGISDEVFDEEEFEFKFKCGLTAYYKNGFVKIGRRELTNDEILNDYLPMFNLVDQITIEGNEFNKAECLEFAQKLKKL